MKKILLLLCVMLSGCALFQQQENTSTSLIENQDYQLNEHWWTIYQNQELNQLSLLAQENNPDYLKALLKADKSYYQLRLSMNELFPSLNGAFGASTQRNIGTHDHFKDSFSSALNVNYEIDLYGKIQDAYFAQKSEYQATLQDVRSAQLTLTNTLVDSYFHLIYLQNAIQLAQDNLTAYQKINTLISKKYQLGKSDELPLRQTQQSLLSEQNKILELKTQQKEAQTNLKNLLNTTDNSVVSFKAQALLNQKTGLPDLNIPLSLLENRPDVQAARLRLEKAFKTQSAQQKNWYPNISISSAIQSSSDKARTTLDMPFLMGRIQIDLPFLDWNRVQSNIMISKKDYELALLSFKETLNQAINETAYYVALYQQTQKLFENTQKNYQNAQKIASYYQTRYQYGKVELKDYLEAIRTKNSLHQELIRQKYQLIRYENNIYKSCGGLFQRVNLLK